MILKYNLKLALRAGKKHRKFFLISIISLTIGISASCLLWLHIRYEKSYDNFYYQAENIYRINYSVTQGGKQIIQSCRTPVALGLVLPEETDLIESACCAYYEDCYMYTDNVKLYNQKVIWADSAFLNVFQNEMIMGKPSEALAGKYSIVISDKVSQIYFDKLNPIGKVIKLNEGIPFTVTGVFKSIPDNTHLPYDFITSFRTLEDYGVSRQNNWGYNFVCTYIRTKEEAGIGDIENALAHISEKYLGDRIERGQAINFSLMPVKDIYLQSNFEGEFKPLGNSTKISLLTLIALFILFIAWTNNINIATAMSFDRAKDSGIRKINGATGKTLFSYFITESFLINLVSVIASVIILIISKEAFKSLVNGAIVEKFIIQSWFLWVLALFLLVGVIFTGVFPAILQSSFHPLKALKKVTGEKANLIPFRTILSVFQFTLAIILIGSTLLVVKQIRHIEAKDLGMKAEQVLVLRAPATNNTSGPKRYAEFCSFREDLLQYPYFKSITASTNVPGQPNRFTNILVRKSTKQIDASFNISQADENYFKTYQVPIIAGRNFYGDINSEQQSIIINEKAVEALEFESASRAIGQKIFFGSSEREIVGVVQNFHHESLQKAIEPYIYTFVHPPEFGYYPVLVSTSDVPELVSTAEKVWNNHYPDALFDYFFLDKFFNQQYISYHQLGIMVGISSVLAILIACLGLYAFVSYSINRRVKEIGVRKVNGAKISEILTLLNKVFVRWVVIAFIIAIPVIWVAMHKWLENFAYQTGLSWWIFALAGLTTLVIALLTVIWQSWKAARRNPVEALRYE